MTHILITDLREIRYMAYVPEEPKYCVDMFDAILLCGNTFCRCDNQLRGYRADLEKAKRESIEFDREEDCKKIIMAIFYSMAEQDNISPGIYQVPVDVEVDPVKKVARIVQLKEPKPESQEELWNEVFQFTRAGRYKELSSLFSLTRN